MKPRIRAASATMKHIREGMDILGEDIAEMVRRLSHPDGRKGYRMRALTSELGIPGHRNETISIKLGRATDSNTIIVIHEVGPMTISVSVDGLAVVRFPESGLGEQPLAVLHGLTGRPLSALLDFSKTSLAELGDAPIHSVFNADSKGLATVYVKAPITEYDAGVFVKTYSPDKK